MAAAARRLHLVRVEGVVTARQYSDTAMTRVKPSIRPTETSTELNFVRVYTASSEQGGRVATIEHSSYRAATDRTGSGRSGWRCETIVDGEAVSRGCAAPQRSYAIANDIPGANDVKEALGAGADAAVLGTRFVMSDECRAAPAYKQRLMESRETVLTQLFGVGWPSALPARDLERGLQRWLGADGREPGWVGDAARALSVLPSRRSSRWSRCSARSCRCSAPTRRYRPAGNLLDTGALYAGESVARLHDVRPAGEITRELGG